MAEASIVFRNEDMSSTGKIYVDTMKGAAQLAAVFRDASHWVDVINRRDEVAYRWQDGQIEWDPGDMKRLHHGTEAYFFDPGIDDDKAEMWDRMMRLSEMIEYAFKVATGQEEAYIRQCGLDVICEPDLTLWQLIEEAEFVAETAPDQSSSDWADHIMHWMQNAKGLYLKYRVEYAAVFIKSGIHVAGCRVPWLEIELAELEAAAQNPDMNLGQIS